MKKTYAYIKYAAPKLNKHGSFDAADASAICLGVTLNLTEKERFRYRQAEIEYPGETFCIWEAAGHRTLRPVSGDEPVALNDLLQAGVIRGRMFVDTGKTVEFTCLDDLTSGKPIPVDTGPGPKPCPHCRGGGTVTAFVDCADRSQSGIRQIKCPDCQGQGTVTAEYLERKAIGEGLREDRLLRGVSLREEAKRRGISVKELSDLEHGRL